MAIPQNKVELQKAIKETYAKLQKDLETIPSSLASQKELEGHAKGTQMSVCNLVSYLIGWGELVLKWNTKIANKEKVDFPETGYKWTELGLLAQKFYQDYEKESYESLLDKLEGTIQSILEVIEKTSNEDLYQTKWYKEYPMGRMIQLNTSSPYKNARTRVRKWKREKEYKRKK